MNNGLIAGITILVPALNEAEVIYQVASEIHSQVARHFEKFEIILVNDGSVDDTGVEMERFAASHRDVCVVHNHQNLGLGAAYKMGIVRARFEYYMLLCGDGGMPASSLPDIFQLIGTADIVAPYMTNLKRIKSPMRYFTSRGYTWLLNVLFGQDIRYYNGLAIHRTELLQRIQINSTRFAFQGEVMTKLLKVGCSCVQVGVLGAENTNRSSALSIRNIASVAQTLARLIIEIARFDAVGARSPDFTDVRRRDTKTPDA